MLNKRSFHILIIGGILALVLPMGFDLKTSVVISVGFGSVFSLLRLNARLLYTGEDSIP